MPCVLDASFSSAPRTRGGSKFAKLECIRRVNGALSLAESPASIGGKVFLHPPPPSPSKLPTQMKYNVSSQERESRMAIFPPRLVQHKLRISRGLPMAQEATSLPPSYPFQKVNSTYTHVSITSHVLHFARTFLATYCRTIVCARRNKFFKRVFMIPIYELLYCSRI